MTAPTYPLAVLLAIAAEFTPPDPATAGGNGNGHHEPARPAAPDAGDRPGDDFNARARWTDAKLLGGAGWRLEFTSRAGVGYWKRPGKKGPGISATTNALGTDRLRVFSTSTEFETRGYSKFKAYAVLHHHGDDAEAAKALRAAGYGAKRTAEQAGAGIVPTTPFQPYVHGPYGPAPMTTVELPAADVTAEQLADPNALHVESVKDFLYDVDNAADVRWLLRDLWPSGDYGVMSAEPKAQKTWNAVDLAVAVAGGVPWLGGIPLDDPGPVLLFSGEGGRADLARRLRAVCAARGLVLEDLPISICTRAPHLARGPHLDQLAAAVDGLGPKLVVLDPLYLSMGGANTASLSEVGAILEGPQRVCQRAGAGLLVVHHHNKQTDKSGAARMTGAGPAEWGRVLITVKVISRHTDHDGKRTTVVTDLEVVGGAVAGRTLRLMRRIEATDPEDMRSLLIYSTTVDEAPEPVDGDEVAGMGPARVKLLEAVRALNRPASGRELVDWINEHHGHGLKRETVSRELHALAKTGLVDDMAEPGHPSLWFPVPADDAGEV